MCVHYTRLPGSRQVFSAKSNVVSKIGKNNRNKISGKSYFSECAEIYFLNMLTFSKFFGVEQRCVTVLHILKAL